MSTRLIRAATGGGSGTPSLPYNSVQWNNAGAFGGNAKFTWDDTHSRLGVNITSPQYTLDVDGDIHTTSIYLPKTVDNATGIVFKYNPVLGIYQPFIHNYGTQNQFFGVNCGNFTMTGTYNLGFGNEMMTGLTTGSENLGFGYSALGVVTEGTGNVCIGGSSGLSITKGSYNICIGNFSGDDLVGTEDNQLRIGSNFGTPTIGGDVSTGWVYVPASMLVGNTVDTGGIGATFTVDGSATTIPLALTGNGTDWMMMYQDIFGFNLYYPNSWFFSSNDTYLFFGSLGVSVGLISSGVKTPTAVLDIDGDAKIHGIDIGLGSGHLSTDLALGSQALNAVDVSSGYNIGIGLKALYSNTGSPFNLGLGSQTLYSLTSGSGYNVAIGRDSLYSSIDSSWCVGIGAFSLKFNLHGTDNIGIGYAAGYLVTGSDNIAIGFCALYTGGNINSCIAIGTNALISNTASNNVAIGYSALYGNTSGSGNFGIGHQVLYANQTGNYNVAIGYLALTASTSDRNSAIGFQSQYANIDGVDNSSYGCQTLLNLTHGYGNCAFSTNAGRMLTTGYNNIAIGYDSMYGGGGTCGSSYSNIAIGDYAMFQPTAQVFYNLAIGSYALTQITSAKYCVAIGALSLYSNQSTNSLLAIGASALQGNTSGAQNVAIGYFSLANNIGGSVNTAVGYYSMSNMSDGNYNLAIGGQSLWANVHGTGNMALGAQALYSNLGNYNVGIGYNTLYYALGNYNIGIGGLVLKNLDVAAGGGNGNCIIGFEGAYYLQSGSYNLGIGYVPLFNLTSGSNNIAIGYWAGAYETSVSNTLYIDGLDRGTLANGKAQSLIYGVFDATPTNQLLYLNGVVFPVQAATASAPAYVKGGLYFDTTLNKLRIGGATAWETVTSV